MRALLQILRYLRTPKYNESSVLKRLSQHDALHFDVDRKIGQTQK